MAVPKPAPPTLQLVAVFSRFEGAISWAFQQIETHWGAIALRSSCFPHAETSYYEQEMGSDLKKRFAIVYPCSSSKAFYDPSQLATDKLQANGWESNLADSTNYPCERPVNIDPGYLSLTKLVLASAKDRAHRIYLKEGIYAEECLYYLDRRWQSRPWTYPDYQRDDFQEFFELARDFLKQRIAEAERSKH